MNKSGVLLVLLLVGVTQQQLTEEETISQERVSSNSESIQQTSKEAPTEKTTIEIDKRSGAKPETLIEIKARKDPKHEEDSVIESKEDTVLRKDASKETLVSDSVSELELYSSETVPGTDIPIGIDKSTTATMLDGSISRTAKSSIENTKHDDSDEATGRSGASKESSSIYPSSEEEYSRSAGTVTTRRMLSPSNVFPENIPGFGVSNAPVQNTDVSNIPVDNTFGSKRNYTGNSLNSYIRTPFVRRAPTYPHPYNTSPSIFSTPAALGQQDSVHRTTFTNIPNKAPVIREMQKVENTYFSTSPPQHDNVFLKLYEASKPAINQNPFYSGDYYKQPEVTNYIPNVFKNFYSNKYAGFNPFSYRRK